MKKIESALYKVSAGGLIALIPFIQYWSSDRGIANITAPYDSSSNPNDSASAPASIYATFQSTDPLLQYATYTSKDSTNNITLDAYGDLSVGLHVTNQERFNSAFNGGYADEKGDVLLNTLIYGLDCVDNAIDLGWTTHDKDTDILLNYAGSSWFDWYRYADYYGTPAYTTSEWAYLDSWKAGNYGLLTYFGPSKRTPPGVGYIVGGAYQSVSAKTSNSFSIDPKNYIQYPSGTFHSDDKPIYAYNLSVQFASQISDTQIFAEIYLFLDELQFELKPKDVSVNWNNIIKIHKYSDKRYVAYLAYEADLDIILPFRITSYSHDEYYSGRKGPIDSYLNHSDTLYSTISLTPYMHGIG
ncbi:MAG: hypothetical protein LBF36_03350 [Mycoplasmataceae bacterium]|nr:hypothetical protein [Mycoplasmataceae bacterium]